MKVKYSALFKSYSFNGRIEVNELELPPFMPAQLDRVIRYQARRQSRIRCEHGRRVLSVFGCPDCEIEYRKQNKDNIRQLWRERSLI